MKQLTLLLLIVFGIGAGVADSQWLKQNVAATASFRGLSVVNEKIVWASGTEGTVIRTTDGGKTWNVIQVPGAEKLDFRDIEAFDANTAYILSIGNGENSRIYKTTDGGKTWKEQFRNKNEKAFFDAIACWNKEICVAMSDPVDQQFVFVYTADGGNAWKPAFDNNLEKLTSKDGEAAFAASGTCLLVRSFKRSPHRQLFVVSGGTDARVFRGNSTIDSGFLWEVADTALVKGSAGTGIFSIAMFDINIGVIVGGNYEKPNETKNNLAFTQDGGETWKPGNGLTGYRSGVTYIDKNTIVAVGTNGTDITHDGGKTWKKIGNEDLNAVAAKGKRAVWAVGSKGMVVKMK